MSNGNIAYRVSGSAALKPEYIEEKNASASIIDFDAVRSQAAADWPSAQSETRNQYWSSNLSAEESFLDSLKSAFVRPGRVSSANPVEVAMAIGAVAALALLVIFIGA